MSSESLSLIICRVMMFKVVTETLGVANVLRIPIYAATPSDSRGAHFALNCVPRVETRVVL